MPPAPEVLQARREIRLAEVDHEMEAEQLCVPAADVAVPAEVAVDLPGKRVRADQHHREIRRSHGPGEGGIREKGAVVGDNRLSEQARENQQKPVEESLIVKPAWRLHLRQQVAGPLNGTGDEMGKQADKQGVIDEGFGRFQLPVIHVDDICDFLKGVKGNAWWKEDPEDRDRRLVKPERLERRRERIHEEIEVLEKAQKPQVDHKRQGEQRSPPIGFLGPRNQLCAKKIDHGRQGDQSEKTWIPPPRRHSWRRGAEYSADASEAAST
jgi:hypothetical protein